MAKSVNRCHTTLSIIALGSIPFSAGCVFHTPERAARQLVRELNGGIGREGPAAFEQTRLALHLKELHPTTPPSKPIYRRPAAWKHRKERIGLVSSNILVDPPDRFDLRVTWYPPRELQSELMERLLGSAYGKNITWDDCWAIGGGVLEYRRAATETPYLVYSSPGYTRDPLDLVEAAELPHLPSLDALNGYLEQSATSRSLERLEDAGLKSQDFCLVSPDRPSQPRGVCITRYTRVTPQQLPYLTGVAISLTSNVAEEAKQAEFASILRTLGVPTVERVLTAINAAAPIAASNSDATSIESFAVYNNFALARWRAIGGGVRTDTVSIWRRIESPRAWCEHLRPDLERCSVASQ